LVKKREPYRPVAPIVPSERLFDFFDSSDLSPFMTYAPKAKEITKQKAPAIVHYDGTSRVQTLSSHDNEVLHNVICQIGENTGIPILMNTSFNIANEPIVDTPNSAMKSLIGSEADILYINGKRYAKD
jgi:carbamoyltransferase